MKNSEHVLVTSHINPDGDAIGSLLAMGLSLYALGKKTTFYNKSKIPTVYRFLPYVERIVSEIEGWNQEFDTVIVLDCGDLQRVGDLFQSPSFQFQVSSFKFPVIINIDHHITNTYFGDLQLIDTTACATAEIVYRLIREMAVPVDKAIATCIYTGIFTDTGSFRFSNTNKAAFEICNEMVSVGVDPYNVAKNVYGTYSLGRIKLLNMALDSIELSYNGKLSMMTVTRRMLDETGTQPEDVDGLIHYARRIQNVKVAVLLQEYRNGGKTSDTSPKPKKIGGKKKFHVSLRSDGTVDVAAIAADFGGGGHRIAAGFNIESSISDLKDGIFNLAERIDA